MRLGKDRPKAIHRVRIGALVAIAAVAVAAPTGIAAHQKDDRRSVIVTLKSGGSIATTHALGEQAGRNNVQRRQQRLLERAGIGGGDAELFWIGGVMVVRATPEQIAELQRSPEVASVESEPQVRITADGGSLPSPGSGNWGVAAIGADRVWSDLGLTGKGVRVGHIDTGIDPRNPSVSGKVVAWRDFVDDRATPYDDNGHGTHTASTIAGRSVQGAPVGVAPDAELVVAKAIGSSGFAPGSQLLAAAQWIADPDGDPTTNDQPTVVNGSWVAGDANDTWFRGVIGDWRSRGIIPVFATGNSGPGPDTVGSPASYPDVIGVGAIDINGVLGDFSSRGPVTWLNSDGLGPKAGTTIQKPDLVAPGVGITAGYYDGFLPYTGTSMAAPHVAGVVALMRQLAPNITQAQVTAALTSTATDRGPRGLDAAHGAGGVNAPAALIAVGASSGTPLVQFTNTPRALTRATRLGYTVSLTAAESYRFRVNGGPWSAPIASPRFALRVTPGRHRVEVEAIAIDGQSRSAPASHTVVVDRSRPRVSVKWSVSGRAVRFRAQVRDSGGGVAASKIRWRIAGRGATGRQVKRRFAKVVPRRVVVAVTDRAGNRRVVRRLVTPRRATVARASSRTRVRARGQLRVSGVTTRRGAVRATLRPLTVVSGVAASPKKVAPRRQGRRVSKGRFALKLPLRGLPPGIYRLRVETLGRLGRGERVITRTVRVKAR